MPYGSLEEALTVGYELERPYVCHAHDDHAASACVNSATGKFVCYACGNRGQVDLDQIHLTPEGVLNYTKRVADRLSQDHDHYSESWLNTFDAGGPGEYWLSRFSAETCAYYRLGHGPGVGTYPMRDNSGRVLGVVTRDLTGDRPQRYKYPYRVQVSEYLIDYHRVDNDVIILCEGMSDVAAVHDAGYDALGCYKAGLSKRQAELIRKYEPRTIYVGFDMDAAGAAGHERVVKALGSMFHVKRLWWDTYSDLASIPLVERKAMFDQVIDQSGQGE